MKDHYFRFGWPWVVVCGVLGALIAGQFKTQWQLRQSQLPRFARIEVLSEFYQRKVQENQKLSEEIRKLRQEKDQLQKEMAAGQSALQLLGKELEQLKIQTGLVSVEGPGVVVLLKDSPERLPLEYSADSLIVHDLDLVQLVNELKAAGAEAIAINGQRIVAMSEIRCSGPVINVNGLPLGSADGYTVQAIGDPEALEAGLKLPGGIVETLKSIGLVVHVRTEERVVIPALKIHQELRYVRPVPQETTLQPEARSSDPPWASLAPPPSPPREREPRSLGEDEEALSIPSGPSLTPVAQKGD